ncbi:MAG: hypothetical protein ABJC74_02780 [Gemmatimonadota bacterium]
MKLRSDRGFALLVALLATLLVAVLALTAASLALLSRRSSASALAIARAEALAEAPVPALLPIPAAAGDRTSLPGPATIPGWSTDWSVTRLGGNLLLVRAEASRVGPAGDLLAHAALTRLFRCCDSLPPTPLPGGWFGAP